MLVSALRWVFPLSLLTYLVYTLSSMGFLGEHGRLAVVELNQQFDTLSGTYITPHYTRVVKPVVEEQIVPWVIETKERLKIDEKLVNLKDQIQNADKKYKVSRTVALYVDKAHTRVKLKLLRAKKFLIVHANKQAFEAYNWVSLHVSVAWQYFKVQSKIMYYACKSKVDSSETLKPLSYVWYKVEEIHHMLLEKSSLMTWQQRTNFIKSEFMNLVKFNDLYERPVKKKDEVKEAIKELLQPDTTTEAEYSPSDYETSTHYLTSTITVVSDSEVSTPVVDENEIYVDELLGHLERDVNNTLGSALNHLEEEMQPIVNETIEDIKPIMTEYLQALQVGNYKNYQRLNDLISATHKDYEKIMETNKTLETVTRQEVRDVISEAYEGAANTTQSLEDIISTIHGEILTKYFKIVQGTIDVVESFADTEISVYSMKLASLIHDLKQDPEFNNDLAWKGWKRFHAIKEELFNFRDVLFDEATSYRDDRSSNVPKGLGEWSKYMTNVFFHAGFVNKENSDFFTLGRARANIAFQLREGAIRDLQEEESSFSQEDMKEPLEKKAELESEEVGEISENDNDENNGQGAEYKSGDLSDVEEGTEEYTE